MCALCISWCALATSTWLCARIEALQVFSWQAGAPQSSQQCSCSVTRHSLSLHSMQLAQHKVQKQSVEATWVFKRAQAVTKQ
jgi:hypothetical protein